MLELTFNSLGQIVLNDPSWLDAYNHCLKTIAFIAEQRPDIVSSPIFPSHILALFDAILNIERQYLSKWDGSWQSCGNKIVQKDSIFFTDSSALAFYHKHKDKYITDNACQWLGDKRCLLDILPEQYKTDPLRYFEIGNIAIGRWALCHTTHAIREALCTYCSNKDIMYIDSLYINQGHNDLWNRTKLEQMIDAYQVLAFATPHPDEMVPRQDWFDVSQESLKDYIISDCTVRQDCPANVIQSSETYQDELYRLYTQDINSWIISSLNRIQQKLAQTGKDTPIHTAWSQLFKLLHIDVKKDPLLSTPSTHRALAIATAYQAVGRNDLYHIRGINNV